LVAVGDFGGGRSAGREGLPPVVAAKRPTGIAAMRDAMID